MTFMSAIPSVNPNFVPSNERELEVCLRSWEWRMYSGQLYKIMIKGDDLDDPDAEDVTVMPFKPNLAQIDFLHNLWYRNVILKARQLGFTTCITVLYTDHALFNANQRCGIVAHNLDDAEVIFRDKVKFAYENLPDQVRARCPLQRDSAKELLFAHNNSSIRVATSMRGGTIHRLHVSEMGKIAAKFPDRAVEVVTGSLPAVPKTGIATIESTAEGQSGEFFKIATKAQANHEMGKRLNPAEYRFHFYPWHFDKNYQMDPEGVHITPEDHAYFDKIERECGMPEQGEKLTLRQRAWYIAKRENEYSGDAEKMWREFPSTPEECWQKSTEGTFFARELARARVEGRIGKLPVVSHVRVNTFWDIGSGDGTGIWLHQHVGTQDRFIGYIEGWALGFDHYVKQLRDLKFLYGGMFLPHDANHERQMKDSVGRPIEWLQELAPDWNWHVVPRISEFQDGINMMRRSFSKYHFNVDPGAPIDCSAGLEHLGEYRKKWNQQLGEWGDKPPPDSPHREAADSLRQHATGFDPALLDMKTTPSRRAKGGMAV